MNQQITSRNTNKNYSHRLVALAWWKRKEGVVLFYLILNVGKDRKWSERKAWWEIYTPKLFISIPFSCIKRLQWRRSKATQNVKERPLMRCSEGTRLPRFSLEDHHQNLHVPQALASRPGAPVSAGGGGNECPHHLLSYNCQAQKVVSRHTSPSVPNKMAESPTRSWLPPCHFLIISHIMYGFFCFHHTSVGSLWGRDVFPGPKNRRAVTAAASTWYVLAN